MREPEIIPGPMSVAEPVKVVEPVTCRVLVPKVATLVFSTSTATEPLATWFIQFGFSPVYLICY